MHFSIFQSPITSSARCEKHLCGLHRRLEGEMSACARWTGGGPAKAGLPKSLGNSGASSLYLTPCFIPQPQQFPSTLVSFLVDWSHDIVAYSFHLFLSYFILVFQARMLTWDMVAMAAEPLKDACGHLPVGSTTSSTTDCESTNCTVQCQI
jgi:hypothetical protein